ncbi:hypothetical protein MKN04_15045 [Paenibacillus polymyxa]|uniref:hypothetical protein n=1 Tax=Paenibacillus polymyxa TaxID=1406 RepID=UPI0004D7C020|nr:hypothetical protein [Paenibacillus polymyxa]KEO77047.1 hypothetical protein EL23_19615 [Paenibacillus polymyxa]MCH6188963.1 hypothetical protein [Paenibacillus polymyxa]WRL57791.1 hypothetical protein U3G77_05795 [Paenibacillus polymyxa]
MKQTILSKTGIIASIGIGPNKFISKVIQDTKAKYTDHYKPKGQSFVIRLRDSVHWEKPHALRRQKMTASVTIRDITCQLGPP